MGLPKEVIEELKNQNINIIYTKEFFENYESAGYILAIKNDKKFITRFTYCSCSGLYEETADSVKLSLVPLTKEIIDVYKENSYIERKKQITFLSELDL